ncbi:unnamed protein product, partial [Porites evermanni]
IFPLVDFSSLSSDFNLPMDIDSSILNVSTDNFDIVSTHSTLNSTSPSLQTTAIPNICRRTTGLKGMVINCNGLKGTYHCTEFQALHKPDIVLGCNSKLHKAVPTYSVFPPYYTVFRKDCDCHGGEVFYQTSKELKQLGQRDFLQQFLVDNGRSTQL